MTMRRREKTVTYRIEDIQYIKVQEISEEGELIAELLYKRVPKNETFFEETIIGENICEYCGADLEKNHECANPDCQKQPDWYHERDIVDFLNNMNGHRSYVVSINDRTYRFNN